MCVSMQICGLAFAMLRPPFASLQGCLSQERRQQLASLRWRCPVHRQYFIYLCVYVVLSPDYTVSNDRMISEQRTGKDVEGRGCVLTLGTIPAFFLSLDLTNTKQEYCSLGRSFRLKHVQAVQVWEQHGYPATCAFCKNISI